MTDRKRSRDRARDAWAEMRGRLGSDLTACDESIGELDAFFGRYEGGRTFNASELPRLRICPASYGESLGKPNVSDVFSMFGRAFHELMAQATEKGRGAADVLGVATANEVDVLELGRLFQRFPFDPHGGVAEHPMRLVDTERGLGIVGYIDFVRRSEASPASLDVVDWKTTWRIAGDPEPWQDPQTKAYGVAVFADEDLALECGAEKVERVLTYKAYPRLGDRGWSAAFEIHAGNVIDVHRELFDICDAAAQQAAARLEDRSYCMSHFCDYCPGRVTCPALRREFAAAISATAETPILKKDGTPGKRTQTTVDVEVGYDNAVKLAELAKLLGKSANGLRAAVKEFVRFSGPIPTAEGKYLAVLTQSSHQPKNEKNLLAACVALEEDPQIVGRLLDWIDALPLDTEERLDFYTEEKISESGL